MKTAPAKISPALLEGWMREYYFETEIDIGSSGVENYSLAEVRRLVGITQEDLDSIVFHDSRTLGDWGLRQAIAQRWGRGDAEWVMATHGSSEAIYMIMHTLLRQGDEVVCLDPCYQQLYSIAESIKCELKPWHISFERQFRPDIEEIKRLINARTRMVVMNFPHNPTGTSVTAREQQELIEVVAETGAYLVWDAAFADLVYEGDPLPDPTLRYDKAVSIGTLSKAYGLPGLRVGWCLASPDVLAQCVHLRDYITLHLSPLVELIARRAIEDGDVLLKPRLRQAALNLRILADWVHQHQDLVEWVRPKGGVCAFLRLRGILDVEDFCRYLARMHKTLLVPGICFNRPSHVRLGFGGPTSEFKEGLARLTAALDHHHKNQQCSDITERP